MITSKEVNGKAEQEIENVANEIFSRIEKRLDEKMKDNSAINEFLAKGRIYIGYFFRIKQIQNEFGYEEDSTSWNALKEKAEIIVKEKLANVGWKIEDEYLIPILDKVSSCK